MNWPGTSVGRLVDGESVSPKAKGKAICSSWTPPSADESEESATPHQEAETEVKSHRRRKKRQIDWDKLRQVRHEHDLDDEEKIVLVLWPPDGLHR